MNEVLRQEKKYVILVDEFLKHSYYFEKVMHQDSHNGTKGYMVRSLYFDTLDNKDYFEKVNGIETRKKIRLRIYNPSDDFALLEMKQKQGIYQKKRSLRIKKEDAIMMVSGLYTPLLNYNNPFAAECYGVMNMQCYRPKVIVQYNRKAFIAKENKIRITFDHNIEATVSNFDLFSKNLITSPVFDRFNVVMEVKYNNFLLSYIRDMINVCNKKELSVSKYCLGRNIEMCPI